METTIDLPDPLFREAKSKAASEGISLKAFITRAVEANLHGRTQRPKLTTLIQNLPKFSKETIDSINHSVGDSDAADLKLQTTGFKTG